MDASDRTPLPPGNPAGPRRHPALAVRRDRRRRCSSPRASSTTAPSNARRGSRATSRAISTRASPIRPWRCSRTAWPRSKARKPRARRRPAWRPSPTSLMGQLKAGDHVVAAKALFGSCRYVVEDLLPRFGVAVDPGRRHRSRPVAQGGAAQHAHLLPREPDQPDAGGHRHRRGRRDRPCGGRDAGRRQRLRHAAAGRARSRSAPTASSIRPPSTSTARAAASAASSSSIEEIHRRPCPSASCARPARRMSPFNAWVLLKGLETLAVRVRAADRDGRDRRRSPWSSTRRFPG